MTSMKSNAVMFSVVCGFFLLLSLSACSSERDLESQLVVAARAKDIDRVRQLLDQGVSPNAKETVVGEGRSALFHAASYGAIDIVRLLIAKGGDVNETKDGRRTPLMMAAVQGYEEVVVVLLNAGANINAREGETGATALTDAVRKGHVGVAKTLISRGADVN